jgi:hypothetical protein
LFLNLSLDADQDVSMHIKTLIICSGLLICIERETVRVLNRIRVSMQIRTSRCRSARVDADQGLDADQDC